MDVANISESVKMAVVIFHNPWTYLTQETQMRSCVLVESMRFSQRHRISPLIRQVTICSRNCLEQSITFLGYKNKYIGEEIK